MALDRLAVVLVVACVIFANGGRDVEASNLAKIDCTKCRLDVYVFGSKDYDCGISRHNNLPICAVDCKILYDMSIPIPNLNLDFDLNTCVESAVAAATTSTSTTAAPPPTTTPPSPATATTIATTTTTVTADPNIAI